MCLTLQINTSFLISQQKTYIFTQEIYISPLHISIEVYLGPSQTSKVDLSAKIVNGYTRK